MTPAGSTLTRKRGSDSGTIPDTPVEMQAVHPAPLDDEAPMNDANKENAAKISKADPATLRRIMGRGLELIKGLGSRTASLYRKIHKDRSPEGMLQGMAESVAVNAARRAEVSTELEKLHAVIVEKKRSYETASPMRKRVLKAELGNLMATYSTREKELNVLLENERILIQTQGRIQEIVAYELSGVKEEQIDRIVDEIEERVGQAEGRVDASRELESAGRRRERDDADDFDAMLAAFDEPGEELAEESVAAGEPHKQTDAGFVPPEAKPETPDRVKRPEAEGM